MTFEFNLIDRPWILCVRRDGTPATLSLRDTFAQAHTLRELSGDTPLETAALHRLMLALLHRVLGPSDEDAWADLRSEASFDMAALDDYWDCYYSRFDLFNPDHPFYQAEDERVKRKPPNSLVLDLAFGNKGTLFDHHTDDEALSLSPAKAARALVTLQTFGLAGLSGIRGDTFTDAPWTRGVVFLIQGRNLFETLMLNALSYPTRDDILLHHAEDRPAWEMDDPFDPKRTRPLGYLDYLTWQNRRILLFPEITKAGVRVTEMTMAPGLRLDSEVLDPMHHYRIDDSRGYLVMRFNEERALWRDSVALFKLHSDEDRPPRTFGWLAELIDEGCLESRDTRRYLALGMANNQARVDFYRSERLPLPMIYLTAEGELLTEYLQTAMETAESVRRQLWGAARTLATYVLVPQADAEEAHKPAREDMDKLTAQWAVERDYWVQLEIPFYDLVAGLTEDIEDALDAWHDTVRRVAWQAFDYVAAQVEHDPRNLKAAVRGRGQLAAGLSKTLPASKSETAPAKTLE
jgi:CRISPR system Cascade subunit CasA